MADAQVPLKRRALDETRTQAALEALTVQKGAASRAQLEHVQAAWDQAAKATPHGQAVVLADDALLGAGF